MRTISKAERLSGAAREAYRQLFRESGRKDSEQYGEVLQSLQSEYLNWVKLYTEQTDPKITIATVEHAALDVTKTHLQKGSGDSSAIMASLDSSRNFQKSVLLAAPCLAQKAVKQSVSGKLQRSVRTIKKAEESAHVESAQLELEYENIEEFRGVPISIRYVIPENGTKAAHVSQVEYRYSNRDQRRSSLKLQEERNRKNEDAYQIEKTVNDLLEPLVDKYGDHPPAVLWNLKLQDDRKRRHGKVN